VTKGEITSIETTAASQVSINESTAESEAKVIIQDKTSEGEGKVIKAQSEQYIKYKNADNTKNENGIQLNNDELLKFLYYDKLRLSASGNVKFHTTAGATIT